MPEGSRPPTRMAGGTGHGISKEARLGPAFVDYEPLVDALAAALEAEGALRRAMAAT
ncbi:MAG: hypothetical protein WAS21_03870 [Geminicoccaceae bacterium]